tara:strand:- start:765 stop:911 length:147 start_codon:yes stop_codon:yes gene_type:complete
MAKVIKQKLSNINTGLKDQLEKFDHRRSDKVLNFKYRNGAKIKYMEAK